MKLSAKTGAALTITALSLAFTVGAGASDTIEPVDAWVIHCCTAYSEAAPTPSTSVTPVDARVISCCTAYSEDVPSTSVTPLPTFLVMPLATGAG